MRMLRKGFTGVELFHSYFSRDLKEMRVRVTLGEELSRQKEEKVRSSETAAGLVFGGPARRSV